MAKQSLTGKRTGTVVSCRPDRRDICYRVRVRLEGSVEIKEGTSPYMLRVGTVVVLAGDRVGE